MTNSERHPFEVAIHLRRTDAPTPASEVGLALAKRLDAWAIGLHVVPLSPVAFASPEAVALYTGEVDELYRTAVEHAAQWRSLLDRHGVAGEWQVTQGDVVESLCHASRWCDLVVVERPQLVPDAPTGWGVVSRTVFGASAPVVVVPESAKPGSVATRVLIAWNQSREAMLAIRGALPLLARAERVLILEGDLVENPFGLRYLPKFDLRAWLARHGIDAEIRPFSGGKERGAALLDAARTDAADLIVMGAWGHSRITELVLGGTTRHLFQHSDLPLLVAH
ncbi:universal stress protein [Dokdonella sp.]|uniref:universal stress protein n=1 Tax=Dokdonella sp. TaxID=2291710 RepID=UPI001B11B576|nr:universal stress protein [Dokdonella sp.]MBO9664265.1 universal stress protein [Dokdonella sp.]